MKRQRERDKNKKRAYDKQYRKDNAERLKVSDAKRYLKNKDTCKKYLEKNKERLKEWRKKYHQENRNRVNAQSKQYRQNNKGSMAKYRKMYNQTEKGKSVSLRCTQKRRALKRGAIYEIFDAIEVFKRDAYKCQHCGRKTRPDYKNINHPFYPNLDHIIPLSRGGSHTRQNTQCLCHQCNLAKGSNYIGDQLRLEAI